MCYKNRVDLHICVIKIKPIFVLKRYKLNRFLFFRSIACIIILKQMAHHSTVVLIFTNMLPQMKGIPCRAHICSYHIAITSITLYS